MATERLRSTINGDKLFARAAEYDSEGNKISVTYATKAEMQAALGDIETLLAAL